MMRAAFFFFIFLITSFCACKQPKPNIQEALTGNWLVIGPDDHTKDRVQREIYAKAQDSIVSLMGLKLISIHADGNFQLVDSLYRQKGKWTVANNELNVKGAGKGWEDFNGRLINFQNNTLQIVEYIPIQNESIRVVWFLKKVNEGHDGAILFKEEKNRWREKPKKPETKAELKKKVKDILEYYSNYYKVVSKEAIYFTGARVALPFRYYQHAAGLLPFNENDAFSKIFYDREDAKKAYEILEDVFFQAKEKGFPSAENYVIEYSVFMQRLANRL